MCDFPWTFFINYSLSKSDDLCFPCSFVPFCRTVCTLFRGGWWAQSGCQVIAHQLSSCSENYTFAIGCLFLCWLSCYFLHIMTLVVLQQYNIGLCFICAPEQLPVPLPQKCLSCTGTAAGSCRAVVHFTALLFLILFIQTHVWTMVQTRPLHSGYSTFLCVLSSYFALL